jgi:hypothetical protein
MSFFRVSTVAADVALPDLGITLVHPVTSFILSNQFSHEELGISKDLESAIIGGQLTAQVLLESGWTSVVALSFTLNEIYAAYASIYELVTSQNSNELVQGGDTSSHKHDQMYYTETELGAAGGAGLIGANPTAFTNITGATAQALFASIDSKFGSFDLDNIYTNDADGILNINGASKNLTFRSNNTNKFVVDRKVGTDTQKIIETDLAANELLLGGLAAGILAQFNTRVLGNLIVDGDFTYSGTITDQTVNNLQVSNQRITLLEGASVNQDAFIAVNRPIGAEAVLKWNETTSRWQAGLEGSERTIALLNNNETVTGIWDFQGGGATDPNLYLTNKATASTTNLGSASQIPVEMINNTLAIYDKTRTKTLSAYRETFQFTGRDSATNTNEYARIGSFSSMNAGAPISKNMTLVGIRVRAAASATWTVQVRKNGVATVISSLAVTAAAFASSDAINIDLNANDHIQVFISGTNINRPVIELVLAERF